jgi:hypothetical protein
LFSFQTHHKPPNNGAGQKVAQDKPALSKLESATQALAQ